MAEPVPEPVVEELEGGAAEASGAPVVPAGVANPPCCATHTQLAETTKGGERTPVFGLTAPSVPRFGTLKVRNRRARRANKATKLTTVFEYACSPNSMLGRVDKELGVPHVRLCKEELDVQNPIVATQLHEQLRSCKTSSSDGIAAMHFWVPLASCKPQGKRCTIQKRAGAQNCGVSQTL